MKKQYNVKLKKNYYRYYNKSSPSYREIKYIVIYLEKLTKIIYMAPNNIKVNMIFKWGKLLGVKLFAHSFSLLLTRELNNLNIIASKQ